MSAVILSSLFASWQRPGAVKNLKISEFDGAVLVDDVHIISVCDHKTGVGGAARLGLKPKLFQRIKQYLTYVRPCMTNGSEIDNVFILPDGKITKLLNLMRFMETELKISIPSATEVRKIGSTAVAKNCTEGEARVVAQQMAHDPRVATQYYQAIRGAKDAKKAFDTLAGVFDGPSTSNVDEQPKLWDSVSNEIVREKFKEYIARGKPPKQSACDGVLKDKTSKQVRDKVRTIITRLADKINNNHYY